MYSRQQRTSKSSPANVTPVSNQFAPSPATYQPQVEQPKPDQTTDLQEQSESENPLELGFIDGAIFSRQVIRPEPPGLQMKRQIDQSIDQNQEESEHLIH